MVSPSKADVSAFCLMLEQLDGLYAELAAARRADDHFARKRSNDCRISALEEDEIDVAGTYRLLNHEFHSLVARMAHTRFLTDRHSSLLPMSDFFIRQAVNFALRLKNASAEHQALIVAITNRRPLDAHAAAERHIREVAT